MSVLDHPASQLLPHQPPALLIADVLELFPGGLRTRVTWPEGEGTPLLLIEAAAQSVATYQGYQKTTRGERMTEGFLVAVRDFSLPAELPLGGVWTVRIQENKNLRPFYLFDATVFHDHAAVAAGTITLFEKEPA